MRRAAHPAHQVHRPLQPATKKHGVSQLLDPVHRWMDISKDAAERRNARHRQRAHRQATCKDQPSGASQPAPQPGGASQPAPPKKIAWVHKRKRLPCCGKERRQCYCGTDVKHMLKQQALDTLVHDIKSRELLTPRDPKDMSYIKKTSGPALDDPQLLVPLRSLQDAQQSRHLRGVE